MPRLRIVTPLAAGLLGSALLASAAWPQDAIPNLFTTEDFRADREHWTNPAYYLNNTAREITDMQVNVRYGEEGSGNDRFELESPYDFATAEEHYAAWLEAANGGVEPTEADMAKFDGFWGGSGTWLSSNNVQASTIASVLSDQYREYYVQQVLAEAQGRHWWPASFCFPEGLIRAWPFEVMSFRPDMITMTTDVSRASAGIRWIDLSDRGHTPPEGRYLQWFGESIGFWDGSSLVIHTNQLRGWNSGHSIPEWSDLMETVERFTPNEDGTISAEITMYDPLALAVPVHASTTLEHEDSDYRPIFSTCTDTQGPARNIWVDEAGVLQERNLNDPLWWDYTNRRPWADHYAIGEASDGWREQRHD